jgi:hypothetical protein
LGFWEVVGEDLPTERIALDVKDVLPSHPPGGEVEASDAGEEGAVCHGSKVNRSRKYAN